MKREYFFDFSNKIQGLAPVSMAYIRHDIKIEDLQEIVIGKAPTTSLIAFLFQAGYLTFEKLVNDDWGYLRLPSQDVGNFLTTYLNMYKLPFLLTTYLNMYKLPSIVDPELYNNLISLNSEKLKVSLQKPLDKYAHIINQKKTTAYYIKPEPYF